MSEELKQEMHEAPAAHAAPAMDKRSIRVEGLKLAGLGVLWLLFVILSGLASWLYKTGTESSGLIGAVLLSATLGVVGGGPLLTIVGLFQAASGYRTKPAKDIFGRMQ